MHKNITIRARITAAHALIAIMLCAAFTITAIYTVRVIERELISNRLNKEFDRMILQVGQGLAPNLPLGMFLLQGNDIPDQILQLGSGFHEISYDNRSLHVLNKRENGSLFVLAEDQSNFERYESYLFLILGGTFCFSVVLAILLGRMTASRVIAPLTTLAQAVSTKSSPENFPLIDSPDEIGVLARAFASRTEELERFVEREKLFSGDVSHELRTPLAVILGASELLMKKVPEDSEIKEISKRIERVTLETTKRVSALLALSRSPDTIKFPLVDVATILNDEIEHYGMLLKNKPVKISFQCNCEVWISAPPELVAIALGNIIRNACQYTEEGIIDIVLSSKYILIEDTGPGIPEALHDYLFERFSRGKNESQPGSGLGLSITKRVADYLNWQIDFDRDKTNGSRVIIIFSPS